MTDETTQSTTDDAGTPPPPRPPGSQRPPLVRSRDDRMLGGVAAGVARWLDVDPTLVRIGFVVLAVWNGLGVIAYIAGWLLMPEGGSSPGGAPSPGGSTGVDTRDRGPAFWIGVALLGLAALVLVDQSGLRSWAIGPPIVLIGLGVALWQMSQRNGEARPPTPSWTPSDEAATWSSADRTDDRSPTVSVNDASGAWTPPPVPSRRQQRQAARGYEERGLDWTPPPAPVREPSVLGRLTLAVAFLAAGALVTADVAGAASVSAAQVTATVLLLIGVGLLVGSFLGRARWLIIVGVILVPFVVATGFASSLEIDFSAGLGGRDVHVGPLAEDLLPTYELGVGELNIWLDRLEPDAGETLSTQVRLGAGEANVWVPTDFEVRVHAAADVGEVNAPDFRADGQGIERTFVIPATDPSTGEPIEPRGTLDLDVTVGAGVINIHQSAVTRTESTEEFTR